MLTISLVLCFVFGLFLGYVIGYSHRGLSVEVKTKKKERGCTG